MKGISLGFRSVCENNIIICSCFDWTGGLLCYLFCSGGQRYVGLPREKGSVCDPGRGQEQFPAGLDYNPRPGDV